MEVFLILACLSLLHPPWHTWFCLAPGGHQENLINLKGLQPNPLALEKRFRADFIHEI
jgi:hypothetical protein